MKTMGLLFLAMTWGAPWSAVAAATAFDPCGKFAAGHGGSCCYRTPKRVRRSYFHGSLAAETLVSAGDAGRTSPADDGKHEPAAKPSDERQGPGRASGADHHPKPVSLTKANGPKPLPNNRQRPLPPNALHPPSSSQPAGAVRGGYIPIQTVHNAPPVQTSSVVRSATPGLNNVRHRSPNPAVVGGSSNLRSGKTGAINGTAMNRKR
jgi:hypothetical protein